MIEALKRIDAAVDQFGPLVDKLWPLVERGLQNIAAVRSQCKVLLLNDAVFAIGERKAAPSQHDIEPFEKGDELRERQLNLHLPDRNRPGDCIKGLLDGLKIPPFEQVSRSKNAVNLASLFSPTHNDAAMRNSPGLINRFCSR